MIHINATLIVKERTTYMVAIVILPQIVVVASILLIHEYLIIAYFGMFVDVFYTNTFFKIFINIS
jgi:hypothetical protein